MLLKHPNPGVHCSKENKFYSAEAADELDCTEVDSASGFMSRTLMVLKGKTSPETRLSTEDLQVVLSNLSHHPFSVSVNGTNCSFFDSINEDLFLECFKQTSGNK